MAPDSAPRERQPPRPGANGGETWTALPVLGDIAAGLTASGRGLWSSRERVASVSYPASGNALFARVEEESFWFAHRNAVIVDACRRFPPAGAVFDIGGGNGFVAAALGRSGCPAIVVEPGAAGVEAALSRGLTPVVWSTLQDARFVPGSLPAAALFDVLEHVRDDEAFLRLLRDLLAPGGRLYLTVPAQPWLWSKEDERAGHFRRYTRDALAGVLRRAGYDVEHGTYFFAPLPLPIWLRRRMGGRRAAARLDDEAATLRQHRAAGPAGTALRTLLRLELDVLRRGRRIPVGSSCLMVARAGAERGA